MGFASKLPTITSDDFDPLSSQNPENHLNINNKRTTNPFTNLHRPKKSIRSSTSTNDTAPLSSSTTSLSFSISDKLITEARRLLVQAADAEKDYAKQTRILDLIQVFRDTLEKGLDVTTITSKILASQVTHLEKINQKLDSNIKKAVSGTVLNKQPQSQSPQSHQPHQPHQPQNATTTYAAALGKGPKNAVPNAWEKVEAKKKSSTPDHNPKTNFRDYRVIATATEPLGDFSPLSIRNEINKAFFTKGIKEPVIATISKSQGNNLVITTTKSFNANYLLEHEQVWRSLFPTIKEIQKDQMWFKVVCHGIPIADFENNLDMIKSEITTFNKGCTPIGNPFWLSSAEKRQSSRAGSVVVSFGTEQEAKRAISNHLYIAGISVRVQKYFTTSQTSQCTNCQGYGHLPNRCKNTVRCRICAESHATAVHRCHTCNAVNKTCVHSIVKCANCSQNHQSNSQSCEVLLALKTRNTTNTDHSIEL